jgi:hypothetical protein
VGAQQSAIFQEERILGISRRVADRKIERLEIVEVVFYLGSVGDAVTKAAEDLDDVLSDDIDRMYSSDLRMASWQRHIHSRSLLAFHPLAGRELGTDLFETLLDSLFEAIYTLAVVAFLLWWHILEPGKELPNYPLLATYPSHSQIVPTRAIRNLRRVPLELFQPLCQIP